MSRTPYGEERFFSDIVALVGYSAKLHSPLAALREKTGLCELTVRKYVNTLEGRRLVAIHDNLKSGFLELLTRSFGNETANKPTDVSAPKPSVAAIQKPQTAEPPGIVALVDFDNTVGVARGLHFTVSFKKLKDILRTYGRIIFADAFLSPATSNPQTITSLWNAGFQVIVCPMGSKDTDAVDSKLEWRARQYLRESTVAKVFVVSRDRDFSELVNFAADLGKQAVLFDIERHRGAIEGTEEEIVIELPQGKQVALFMRAVDYVGQGLSGLRPDDELRIKFLKDVIAAVSGKEEDNRRVGLRPPSFHVMHGSLIGVLGGQWRQSFTVMDFRNALTALVQQNAIVRRENHVTTFYELNREHPAVKAALLITK